MKGAKFYTQGLENISYIADDLLNINDFERYDYITWFLPFVTYKPLKYWGLPKKFFCPAKLLNHAYSLLSETAQLLIINQGEEESLKQKEILDSLDIQYKELGEVSNEYFQYQNKRYGFLVDKFMRNS